MAQVFKKLRAWFEGFGITLLVLWSVLFLAVFATSMCGPALPYLVRDFIAEEAVVVAMIGYLSSARNLSSTIASSVSGVFADKSGKRNVILASLCLTPIAFLLYSFSKDLCWVFVATLILGFFHGFSNPQFKALFVDLAPRTSMAMVFAFFNLSWILAEIPAPILGGFLSDVFNTKLPFIVAFGISVIALLIFVKGFKSMKDQTKIEPSNSSSMTDDSESQRPHGQVLIVFCLVSLLLGLGDGILMPIITAFLMFRLGTSSIEMGIAFSVAYGLLMALSQVPGAKIADKFGKKSIIIICILVATPLSLLLPFTLSLMPFVVILGLNNFIGYLWSPAFSAWIADKMGVDARGKAFGFTSASYGTGTIVGPAIGGLLWTLFYPNTFLPFMTGTIPFFLIIPLIILLKE